ncbi:MAG TPA: histidine--tRNA ligase [Candidatus Nanoarchaeia archaeon]|nr:histidine--tRNA ligase [Candidatus Nanoarchaeia archaeon]
MTELQLAKGVKDTPPEEKIVKDKVVSTLTNIFELYGFMPLETPILERYETLSAKFAAGEASDALKEIFKLKDQGDRTLGLRFDLTVPLARYVAMNLNLKLPFKRYAVGSVFRDGPIKLGRTREFWQMDIDTVGTKSMLAEAEILAMADSVFKTLNLNVVIKVNNRKLLNGILEQAGIDQKEEAIIAIDKLNKIGEEGVSKELKMRGYSTKQINKVFALIRNNVTLRELNIKIVDETGKEGLAELEELFSYLKSMNVKSAVFDISMARGLAYYTGTVFEAFLKNGEVTSSLAGGGRYDNMIGKYLDGGKEVPAVGISFGLVPIIETLKLEKKVESKTNTKVLVIPINTIKESLEISQILRNSGIATDFSLGKKGVSKSLQYADSLGIPYTIIIGEDEINKKKVLLRDMSSGTEQLLTVDGVVKKLKT